MEKIPSLQSIKSSDEEEQFRKEMIENIKNIDNCNRSQKLMQSLTNKCQSTVCTINKLTTNLVYNVKHSKLMQPVLHRKPIYIRKNNSSIVLLGKSYKYEQNYAFLTKFMGTIWFSYRSDIYGIKSDAGWGCTIRVVQMLFAEIFQRHFLELTKAQVIDFFQDSPQAFFSLTRICQEGQIDHRWTSALEILEIIKRMIKSQNKLGLSLQIYTSGLNANDFDETIGHIQFPCFVSISNRIGVKEIPKLVYGHLKYLLDNKYSVGAIGGLTGQALYIIGYYDDDLLYLDPHYVQNNNEECNYQQYFVKQPHGIPISQFSPSITFCYYLSSVDDYCQWAQWIIKGAQIYKLNTAIQIKLPPDYRKKSQSDQFETL